MELGVSRWVGTWTTTPDPIEPIALAGKTVPNIARISLGGSRSVSVFRTLTAQAVSTSAQLLWVCEAVARTWYQDRVAC